MALASLGRAEEAVASVNRSIDLLPVTSDAVNAPYRFLEAAQVYMRLGRQDQALVYLKKLLSIPSEYSAAWLQIDPWFEDLKQHPRYAELLTVEISGPR